MTRLILMVALLIAAATGAASQDVPVRSGEHDGYTRLVFTVPPETGWVLAQRKNGARLTVAIEDVTFQTGSVFGRLSTNRLASLSQDQPGSALDMEFGCDCVATAFLFKNSMVVVDIAPGETLPTLTADIPPPLFRQALQKEEPMVGLDLPALSLIDPGFENRLSTRLIQGTDRDVLGLNLATIGPRSSLPSETVALPADLGSNISLSTILDELPGPLGTDLEQIEARPACISSAELGFENWSDGRPFPDQVADLRAGLFQEFDRLDTTRVLNLAKLYAFGGFGAEAIQTLELLETSFPDADRISAIAKIVDERRITGHAPFSGLQRCDSGSALWSVLTENVLAQDAKVDAIERAFARLPNHLRRSLGPGLSSIFVNAGNLEVARRILRSVGRIETDTEPRVVRANAQVAEAEGNDKQAETLLAEVATSPSAAMEAPLALARLVEKRWGDRGAVSTQELALAASYATEFRRSEMGPLMTRTHAIALSLNQEFDAAFDLIRSLPQTSDFRVSLNRHLQLLSERSDDITFLRQTLEMPPDLSEAMDTDTSIALSERFAALGFAPQALALANRPQDRVRWQERAQLRARAALMNGRPHQAMLELSDVKTTQADMLRAQGMNAMGEFAEAGNILRELGEKQAANRQYWLAGLPEQVRLEAVGKFATLTATTQALSEPPERLFETPLADAAHLLQDSVDTRQRVSDLLAAVQLE